MFKALRYNKGNLIKDIALKDVAEHFRSDSLLWIDMENPDEEEIKLLSEVFNFHHLAVEDCIHRVQRPKVDNYKDYYFIVLDAFRGRDVKKGFLYSNIYFFIGKEYIVSLHWSRLEVMNKAYNRAIEGSNIFERGIDFVLYTIFDEIVDDYFPLTDKIEDKIDALEEIILKEPKKKIQEEILKLKRNILKLRRILSPQREVLNIILRHDFQLINEENRLYFMDVYDHLLRIYDLIDTYQDLLAGTLDLYMSQISNKMNEVMKVLTIITTIMMPLTVISGIYGMNFKDMPELNYPGAYHITLGVMILLVFGEFLYFKIKKWI